MIFLLKKTTLRKDWFKVKWGVKGEKVIFPLPQSNHYQEIDNLSFSSPLSLTSDNWGNLIGIFEGKERKNIYFWYSPRGLELELPKFYLEDYSPKLLAYYSFLLKPNRFTNGKAKEISVIIRDWKEEKNLRIQIKKAYSFVQENLIYGKPTVGLYSFQQALKERITDCGGFSTLLISLLQGLGVPCRLVIGFILKKKRSIFLRFFPLSFNSFLMHAWAEILLPDGCWFPLDPAMEWRRNHGLTKREGGFGIIPPDRLVVSFGQDFKIKIKRKIYQIDLLQYPIII